MRLHLLRHGPAGDAWDWDGPDETRPLTPKGRAVMSRVASRLAEAGFRPGLVLTSPYVRAVETAAILCDGLGVPPAAEDERLAAGFGPGQLREVLRDRAEVEELVLVGHEPDLSGAVATLARGACVRMRKGALARIDLEDPARLEGELVWLLQPDVLAPRGAGE
jgi:phosphohistidine phosphatase